MSCVHIHTHTGSFAYQWASEREREKEGESSINNGAAEVAFAMFVAEKLCAVRK